MSIVDGSSATCLCFTRNSPTEHVTVTINLSDQTVRIPPGSFTSDQIPLFSTEEQPVRDSLAPWEVRIAAAQA
jgi:hypothetical protein